MIISIYKILRILISKVGIDIKIKDSPWYGIHLYWQSIPLFDLIYSHTKCNTVHKYGFVFFGLWVYVRIDE